MNSPFPDDQLVYTPSPKAGEGLLGYVLRLSEANGYDTPWYILKMAGLTQSQMTSASLSINGLSKVICQPLLELEKLPWQRYPNGQCVPKMGHTKLLKNLLLKHPKICPHCIAEKGIIDPAWDLRLMLACPRHGVALVTRCPACQQRLSWFRPGLMRCRCGHEIYAADDSNFSQHTLDLLQVIYDGVHGLPTNPHPDSKIPARDLEQMGIDDLLKFLGKVGDAISGNEPKKKYQTYSLERLENIAAFLQEWPTRFHQLLRANDPTPEQASVGLTRRFNDVYRSIVACKRIPKTKMLFMRKAFGQYGNQSGISAGADPRFFLSPQEWSSLRKDLPTAQIRRQTHENNTINGLVNQTELARCLGVRRITARRWAEQGLFGLEQKTTTVSGQALYKLPTQLPSSLADTLDLRTAAKYLNIPADILKRLRSDEYYCSSHFGTRVKQFNRVDLNKLRTELLERAPIELTELPAEHITLSSLFRSRKAHGNENKYQIVRSILDDNLIPAGKLGENVGDIVIAKHLINAERKVLASRDVISAISAAKILDCDPSVSRTLATIGELEGIHRGRYLYVTVQSVAKFQERYISCIGIAKCLGVSARYVLKILSAKGEKLLKVQGVYRRTSIWQTFCLKENLEKTFGQELVHVRKTIQES